MYLLVALLLFVSSVSAMEITKKEGLFVPNKLGNVQLFKTEEGFEIIKDSESIKVKSYDVDPILKHLNKDTLEEFSKVGAIHLNQFNNGDYSLKAKGKINGGGPLTGMIAAWCVRAVMYSAAATAATAAISTATVVGTPVAGGGVAAQIAAASPAYIATTEGASTAALIIGYSIVWLP